MSDGSLTKEAFDRRCVIAEEEGFTVIRSARNVLLLDLDTPSAASQFLRVFDAFTRHYVTEGYTAWRSKSGTGWHVRVVLAKNIVSFRDRVALQAALGSDGVREFLSLEASLLGTLERSVLFQPPDSVIHKGSWDSAPPSLYTYAASGQRKGGT